MLSIIKEGRAAFSPFTKPDKICPYITPMSMEQLAWILGWTKASVEHLENKISDYSQDDNAFMSSSVKNAFIQGERDFEPNIPPMTVCPYMGQQYVVAYARGWAKAREKHDGSTP